MSATVLVALVPALGRLLVIYLGVPGLTAALNPSFWIVEAVCLLLLLSDWRERRVYAPYVMALAFLVAVNTGLWLAPHWRLFEAITQKIAGA